jgi:hypothetical protein
MGTKSTPSTQTTQQSNPLGQAQVPYLTGLWDQAANATGMKPGGDPTLGGAYLGQIQGAATNNFNQSAGLASRTVPSALNFTNQALAGTLPQSQLPGGPQIGTLGGIGAGAVNAGTGYGDAISNAAYGSPGAISPYTNALSTAGSGAIQNGMMTGGALANAAYGVPDQTAPWANSLANTAQGAIGAGNTYGGALANMGYGAQQASQGYGNNIASIASQMPGAVAPSVSGLQGLAGQYGGLVGSGYQLGGALQNLAGQAQGVAAPALAGLYGNAGMGVSGNPIYNSLMGMANGQYTDPRSNPALAGSLQAANQALSDTYQTATAPQLASGFESAGRYGSGGMANAMQQAQVGLGRGLAAADTGIVNNAYNTGLQAQLGAGQALGGAFNTGMANANQALTQAGQLGQSGVTNAGNILGQAGTTLGNLVGTGLGGAGTALNQAGTLGLNSLNAALQGYGTAGQVANQGYATGANALAQGAGAANQGYSTGANALSQGGQLNLSSLQQMMSGLYNSGQLSNQGYATGGNLLGQGGTLAQGGQNALISGLTGAAGAANAGYGTGANAAAQAGNLANSGTLNMGGLAQMAPQLANFPLSQASTAFNSMWAPMQNYGSLLGQPIGGNTMTTQTTPYYTNTGQQILSGLTGVASLASMIP